jgi:ATP/maltotriose-dependent transcriptional regulator MalT/DNA-binding CsgD family transcriptional regulator
VCKRLERGVDFPILVVSAPPGFGKSTVLREFFAARGLPYRYLRIDTNHGDLLGFMRAFAHCLGDLAPALLTSFLGVYERMHRADGAAKEIAAWAAGHLNCIAVTLMVDGLENIIDERLFTLLNELVDQTARTPIRWILIARTADRFPIARWLASDRMDLPIDDLDLALTYSDVSAAVERTGAPIASTALRALCRSAANWPAAIALALGDPTLLPALVGDAQLHPYAYFAKRAFAARPERERRFLLETCLYRSFDRAVLEAAGWDDAQAMIEPLTDAGAMLFAEGSGTYRYHELFRTFVEERLRASPHGLYRQISLASAMVCRRVGRWSDALELYTELQEARPLAELLSERGFELMDRGEADLVYRALAALGDAEFAAFPVALAVKASLESLHGSFDLAEAWYRHAIKNVGDSSQRGAIVFRFATDLVRQDRRDAIDVLQPIVAEGGHELALSVSLAGLLATAYATHQQIDQAATTIARALERLDDIDDPAVRAKLYYQAGYVAVFARDPERAKAYARQAVETALASHLFDVAARAMSILYNVAMDYDDDVPAAKLYLDQLASCSIKAGSQHLLMYATLAQFEIEVFRGNRHESARLDQALASLEVDYSTYASEMLLPAQALRATWSGDFHRAYRLIATTAEKQITPMRQAQRYAQIALYAAAAGLHAEAAAAVRHALAVSSAGEAADRFGAFTKAYIALALNLLGRHRRAADVLSRLGRSATLTPRLRLLIEAIRTINDRWAAGRYSMDLRAVLDQLDACDFGGIGRLIQALPLPETFRGQFTHLTAAERDVLIHLSEGLESEEIATLSGRPAQMVDALTKMLCRKLGCTSPRDAVALARSAGILRTTARNENVSCR